MKKYLVFLGIAFLSAIISCSSGAVVKSDKPTADDKLIRTLPDQKPKWLYSEPESSKEFHFFTGMSTKMATEKEGREDALNNSIQNVVKYLGTAFQDKVQKITTTYGLSSQIVDSTNAGRGFQEQISKGLAKKVKAREYYIEEWKTISDEKYYIVRLLANVPVSSIEEAYKDQIDSELNDLRKKKDQSSDEKAKAQFDKAMDAFKKAKNEGFQVDK